MRILFAGTPAVALPSLQAIAASGHEVVAVLTRPDARAGRGRQLMRSPVAAWADERALPVLQPARLNTPEVRAELAALDLDCAAVVAYGALVGPQALTIPRHGWVNLHFSVLPAWRGAAPVQHALIAGDDITGATTFRLTEGLDTGPIYGTLTERVRADDTAGALLDRLAEAGAGLLVATLDGIAAGALVAEPQLEVGVSVAPKISTDDARIRFDEGALAVDRRIRGLTPEPGAWTTFRGERLELGPVQLGGAAPLGAAAGAPNTPSPGELVITKNSVHVGTATTPVLLGVVRAAGKKPMPAPDWARGARPQPGEVLGGPTRALSGDPAAEPVTDGRGNE